MPDHGEGVVIKVPVATSRIGHVAFAGYAAQFLRAGEVASEEPSRRFRPVPFFLFGRATELALKAFLLSKGVSVTTLKNTYGHDLTAVFARAKDEGLQRVVGALSPQYEPDLAAVNEFYKGKAFEYFMLEWWVREYAGGLPPLARFRASTVQLLKDLIPHCETVP